MAEKRIIMSENSFSEGASGAELMRNRCSFTSRDMAADWPEAFTYAIVKGWYNDDEDDEDYMSDAAMQECAEKFGWDDTLVEFLKDAHERFKKLPSKPETKEGE